MDGLARQARDVRVELGDVVLVTVGGDDLLGGLIADRGPGIERFRAALDAFLARLPRGRVLRGNVYDPTSGRDEDNFLPVPPGLGRANLRRMDDVLADLAAKHGRPVDVHGHFLRHGDASWFTHVIEPSLAGASEVRRCFLEPCLELLREGWAGPASGGQGGPARQDRPLRAGRRQENVLLVPPHAAPATSPRPGGRAEIAGAAVAGDAPAALVARPARATPGARGRAAERGIPAAVGAPAARAVRAAEGGAGGRGRSPLSGGGSLAGRVEAYVEVQEGKARLRVPPGERQERGPGSRETGPVFFNPAMAINRDLSCLLLGVRAQPGWTVLDGLAASGLRGIRYALECDAPLRVEWNDWNPVAVRLLEENARLNGLEPRVTHRNLASLLHERVWHAVDLDPFGSPAPFLDGATRAVRDGGLLGVTATDTTALAGVYPNVCRRRYMADPLHGELMHDAALRILAGIAARQGARHDVAFTPVLAHATDYYYRVALACRRGASRADEALRHVGMLRLCPACGHRSFGDDRACPECGARVRLAGPLWTGPLLDPALVDAMQARAAAGATLHRDESRHLLDVLAQEARAPPLPYDVHKVGERAKVGSPPTARVVQLLREAGHAAAPVHFNRLALRTDASAAEMLRVVREAAAGPSPRGST